MPDINSYPGLIGVNFIGNTPGESYDSYELESAENELIVTSGFINGVTIDDNKRTFTVDFYV